MAERKSKSPEDKIDAMLEDSFPASDPPSTKPEGGTKKSKEIAAAHASGGDKASVTPMSDRHTTETAGARQEGAHPAEAHDPTKA